MIPTPIQLARDLLGIHHHMIPDGSKESVIVYKEDELLGLLKNYGFPDPDWEGNDLEQEGFEARMRMEYLISCPGDTIKECMVAAEMTVEQLADKLAWTPERTQRLLDGEAHINRFAAMKLHTIFDIDTEFWLNRQSNYIKKLAEAAEMERNKKTEP